MLADSVSKFMENDYDFERRQKIAESDDGFSLELWQTYTLLVVTSLMSATFMFLIIKKLERVTENS